MGQPHSLVESALEISRCLPFYVNLPIGIDTLEGYVMAFSNQEGSGEAMLRLKRSVLLVDDHKMFREGLKLFFALRDDFEVVAEASSVAEATKLAPQIAPELIILDISMPGGSGLGAISSISSLLPNAKIVILTNCSDESAVLYALETGASGYVLKSDAFKELAVAIGVVFDGHRYLSPSISDGVVERLLSRDRKDKEGARGFLDKLGKREIDVLRLFCEEKTPKVIASELGISRKTVDVHKRNIMAKLKVGSDVGLIRAAIRSGILPT